MAKKKSTTPKRAEGKKLRNFAFKTSDVEKWKNVQKKENRTSLTNLIETVMNIYCKK